MQPGLYVPVMDAVMSEAQRLGAAPAKMMFSEKGALFTGMNASQYTQIIK